MTQGCFCAVTQWENFAGLCMSPNCPIRNDHSPGRYLHKGKRNYRDPDLDLVTHLRRYGQLFIEAEQGRAMPLTNRLLTTSAELMFSEVIAFSVRLGLVGISGNT